MKHKIIEINSVICDAVALNVVRDGDNGDDVVKITAWHYNADNKENYFQEKTIKLPSFGLCERFVEDFSEKSAETFAQEFDF